MPMPLFVSLIGAGRNSDPNFANVVLLLNGDDFVDRSFSPKTVTNVGASINTEIKRFGTGSLQTSPTTYLTIADSDSFWLNGDFTLEMGVRWSGTPGETSFMGQSEGGGTNKKIIFGWNAAGISTTMFIHYGNGIISFNATIAANAAFSPVADTWYDLAWRRIGNNYTFWVNAVQLGDAITADISSAFVNVSSAMFVGRDAEGYRTFTGLFDEIRLTNGTGRTIVIPSGPWPTS